MKNVYILWGGPTRFITDARGKEWRFEDHPRFGPVTLKKNDDPETNQPGEGSLFWPAHKAWSDQDKKIDDKDPRHVVCVWERPKASKA